jgi:hypothetical protein
MIRSEAGFLFRIFIGISSRWSVPFDAVPHTVEAVISHYKDIIYREVRR